MIYLVYGDNEFEKRRYISQLTIDAQVERYDGVELDLAQIYDLTQGQTLFSTQRTIVIAGLSDNGALWDKLPQIMMDVDGTIILLETKLDRRTKTYKWLKNYAKIQEYKGFSDRDKPAVIRWITERSEAYELVLPRKIAEIIVSRVGHDQLRLDTVLQQITLMDEVTESSVDTLLPLPQSESVFELFDSMLQGDREAIHKIIHYLEVTQGDAGAYQTLGLLSSQLAILAGLVMGGDPSDIANDTGAHPFTIKRLLSVAVQTDQTKLRRIVEALARADIQMKSLSVRPWLLLEAAIMETV